MIPDFSLLDIRQAQAFHAHVVAREPARLGDLARWLTATGGPIGALDGSPQSLNSLWPWFVWFVQNGCPSVPAAATPAHYVAFGTTGIDPARSRAMFAAESVQHYVLQVAKHLDPTATWRVYEGHRRDLLQHSTVIAVENGAWSVDIAIPIRSLVRNVLEGDPGASAASALYETVLHNFGWADQPEAAPGESILAPYATVAAVPWEDPSRWSPVLALSELDSGITALRDDRADASEMVLAKFEGEVEDLADAEPLREGAVALTLQSFGFLDIQGEPVTEDALRQEYAQFLCTIDGDDDIVLVETIAAGGRLRAVTVASINANQAQWDAVLGAFRALAVIQGARFELETEFAD